MNHCNRVANLPIGCQIPSCTIDDMYVDSCRQASYPAGGSLSQAKIVGNYIESNEFIQSRLSLAMSETGILPCQIQNNFERKPAPLAC